MRAPSVLRPPRHIAMRRRINSLAWCTPWCCANLPDLVRPVLLVLLLHLHCRRKRTQPAHHRIARHGRGKHAHPSRWWHANVNWICLRGPGIGGQTVRAPSSGESSLRLWPGALEWLTLPQNQAHSDPAGSVACEDMPLYCHVSALSVITLSVCTHTAMSGQAANERECCSLIS